MKRCGHILPMLLLAGCAVGPNYERPAVPVPGSYRVAPAPASAASLPDTKSPDLFHDEAMKQLNAIALEKNQELSQAAERVEEARAVPHHGPNRYPFYTREPGSPGAAPRGSAPTNITPGAL